MSNITVGSGQQFQTIASAVAAAQPGDTVQIQAGTYINDFPGFINGLTIEGVGGQVNLVATQAPPNGKAYLDEGGNTTISGLTISGVSVGDGNGAAIRYEGGNLTLRNDTFTGNQDGLLGANDSSGTITMDGMTVSNNGTSAGNAHDIYIGNIQQFTITNSSITDAIGGHEIKSRAANNTITNNTISDRNSTGSYEIDLPNAGNATISGNTIVKGANSGNNSMIAYGEEGASNPGRSLVLSNNSFDASAYTAHIPHVLLNAGGADVSGSGDSLLGIDVSQAGVPAVLLAAGSSSSADTGTTTTGGTTTDTGSTPASGGTTDTGSSTPTGGATAGGTTTDTGTTTGSGTTTDTGSTPASGGTTDTGSSTPIGGTTAGGTITDTGSTPANGGTGTPSQGQQPASTTSPANIVVGLAEDAFIGDATATVAVDGTTLGQPTVSVLRSSGQDQSYSFQDQLAPGDHSLTITFNNDLSNGTASADRNLYVNQVDINGASYAGGLPAGLFTTGSTLTVPFHTS